MQLKELISIINKLNPSLPSSMQESILSFKDPTVSDDVLKKRYTLKKVEIHTWPLTTTKSPKKEFYDINSDTSLPKNLPDLFNYILNEDYIKIKSLLEEHPELANLKDYNGLYSHAAHELASYISSDEIFKLFFIARKKLKFISEKEEIIQHDYARYFNGEYSVVKMRRSQEYKKSEYKENYLSRMTSDDPVTPVTLSDSSIDPIAMAESPEAMMQILKDLKDPDLSDRFTQAIRQDDVEMVKTMLYYMEQLPEKYNATFFEYFFRNYRSLSKEMFEVFLLYYGKTYEQPLPEGPYNPDLDRGVCGVLQRYNSSIKDLKNKKLYRPVLQSPTEYQSQTQSLIENFISPDRKFDILSIQKPIGLLTEKEKEEMYKLFFYNFSMIKDDSISNQQKYFNKAVSDLNSKGYFVLVNLFYDQKTKKLVSFLTTEIKSSYHETVGDFVFFHGKLAGNNPEYSSLNLTNLSARNFLAEAISQPKPVYMFIKSIPPGYALCTLPFHIDFSPKKPIPSPLLQHIVGLADDALVGEVIPCKLKVNDRRQPKSLNFPLMYYRDMIGSGKENAMPIVFRGDQECIKQYFKLLQHNGISPEQFDNYVQQYNQMKKDRFNSPSARTLKYEYR